jgi:GTP-binding protein LepA
VPHAGAELGPGEVGYLIAGIKDVGEARSGETVTDGVASGPEAAEGYRDPKPMVFCGLYPIDGDEFSDLRERSRSCGSTTLVFTYEPETSGALGFGFRCGFLGLLHMEIVRERLEREFDLASSPPRRRWSTGCTRTDGEVDRGRQPRRHARAAEIDLIEEPFLKVTILTPTEYTGTLMDLCQTRRGEMQKMEYLSPERVELVYEIPLAEVVVDFFDQLKSRTQGYASLDYEPAGYEPSNLVKVDVLLNGVPADAFSTDRAPRQGLRLRRACARSSRS